MSPELWRKSGEWIAFRGQWLFTRSIGQGQPILTLHAFPTSSYDYSRLVPLLAGSYQLILFDYPGYGFSDKPRPHTYSLFENTDALQAVTSHYGVERAFVLAHDIGASVALIALARKTPIVERLVLMNGSVFSIPFDDVVMRMTQRALLHHTIGPLIGKLGLINERFFASTLKRLFSTPLSAAELDAFWSLVTYQNGALLYPILMRYMLERWEHQDEWLTTLQDHPAPLTLIWGMADPIATPAVAEAVMTYRPDAEYVRLQGIGHYPHWEAPEQVASALRKAFAA